MRNVVFAALDKMDEEKREYILDHFIDHLRELEKGELAQQFVPIFNDYREEHPRMITCRDCGEYAEDSGDGFTCHSCRCISEGGAFR